jgi:hypothetical protein
MLDGDLIRSISRSWLYFLSEALAGHDISLVFQPLAPRTSGGNPPNFLSGYVIAAPALEWRLSPTQPDTLEILFRLRVVTAQQPGDILQNYERNLAIQLIVQNILFSDERRVAGYSTGSPAYGGFYAVPLYVFSSEGEPETISDPWGLRYNAATHWINRSIEGRDSHIWTLDVLVIFTG